MARLKRQVQRRIKRKEAEDKIANMAIAYVLQLASENPSLLHRHIMRDRLVWRDAERFVAEYTGQFPGEYKTPKQCAPLLAAYAEEWGFKAKSNESERKWNN